MKYRLVIKWNELLTHTTMWTKPVSMLRERSQPQKITYSMIPFI